MAMSSDRQLWDRIREFPLDRPQDDLPFSARLAGENGWTRAEAKLAIDEYRKFIYLVCVSPAPLTPSEAVDQVWHLHLVYTRSYWADLCAGVIGRPLHHEPTAGGAAQARLFREQYARTLALYEAEFGQPPPARIWPSVSARFAAADSRWVDRRRYWIVRKPAGLARAAGVAASALVALLLTGSELGAEEGATDQPVSRLLVVLLLFGLFAVFVFFLERRRMKDGAKKPRTRIGHGGCGNSCGGLSGCGGGGCGGGCGS